MAGFQKLNSKERKNPSFFMEKTFRLNLKSNEKAPVLYLYETTGLY